MIGGRTDLEITIIFANNNDNDDNNNNNHNNNNINKFDCDSHLRPRPNHDSKWP